ncbi:MAG TPA: hypothetical protein VE623_17450 [Acidimicrobiales bacterium]|jgi:hypothetical protein|nr:hypothetical protein [Acidimicrobiales bacterium]
MAASSFRDRFFTAQVARAITSPLGILLGGGVAAATIVAGAPLVAALPLGVAVWAGKVALSIPRQRRGERIDPFTLQEPWRRYVQEALQARNRFNEAVARTRAGPLRDHLAEIAARMQTGVEECWLIAKRGQTLVEARRGIDLADIQRQIAEVAGTQATARGAADPSLARVAQSLEAQRATAERLDRVITQAHSELRMLDARLDEAVARTLELSAHATADTSVEGLGTDVDALVTEMESLRQALEETSRTAQDGLTAGGAPE